MAAGHWSRLRAKGGGPRGGGGGHDKGPLRKIVRHRKLYTVTACPVGSSNHWRNWTVLVECEDYDAARSVLRQAVADVGKWSDVRYNESDWREVLECGHDQMPMSDLIGETNATRRRCRKCKMGKPVDVATD